jgi:hypothetical protein
MNSRATIVLALSASFAAGLLVGESHNEKKLMAMDPSQTANAAFRDGMYQAKLDVEEGRRPHFSIGRWSAEKARALFVAGYLRGYREASETASGEVSAPSVAELAASGYRDGLLDGSWHRTTAQLFHPDQTDNYRGVGFPYLESNVDREEYKRFYREGYLKGYASAYYPKTETLSDKSTQ